MPLWLWSTNATVVGTLRHKTFTKQDKKCESCSSLHFQNVHGKLKLGDWMLEEHNKRSLMTRILIRAVQSKKSLEKGPFKPSGRIESNLEAMAELTNFCNPKKYTRKTTKEPKAPYLTLLPPHPRLTRRLRYFLLSLYKPRRIRRVRWWEEKLSEPNTGSKCLHGKGSGRG